MPPEVGIAEASSAIEKATQRTSSEMIGQPIEMAIGPPLLNAWP